MDDKTGCHRDVIMMLFKTCVMPTFEYGVGLWGVASVCAVMWIVSGL